MARLTALLLSLFLVIVATPIHGLEILVYFADYIRQQGLVTLKSNLYEFNHVSFDFFVTNFHGGLIGNAQPSDVALVNNAGQKSYMCVSNYGKTDFSSPMGHAVLSKPHVANRLIGGIVSKIKSAGFSGGVNIDFESLRKTDRARYTAFLTNLRQQLPSQYKLVASIPAFSKDSPQDSWVGAYDLSALSAVVDIAQVMSYDEHGPWSKPGPVSSMPFFLGALKYFNQYFNGSRIAMGLPAYGYNWDLSAGTAATIPWNAMPGLISDSTTTKQVSKWDSTSMSPSLEYVDSKTGHNHVVWYENAESIKAKVAQAKAMGAGISVWALGLDDADFWTAVNSA